MGSKLLSLALSLILVGQAFAAPDQQMSISPAASSNTTISSSDENDRNNDVSTAYNAHTHTDITSMSSVNTFTIGDNATGSKTYAVDTDQANDPGVRYNTATDQWTLSQDGASYLAVAHAETTGGLQSGSMIYGGNGTQSGAIVSVGRATGGQVLVGVTNGVPVLGNISWLLVQTLDTSSGTSVSTSTLPTDSDLFMVVFEGVLGTAGSTMTFTGIDNHISIRTATVTAVADNAIAAFGTGTTSSVNGVLYVPRLATNSKIVCPASVSYVTTGGAQATLLRCEDTGASDLTTMTFGATNFTGGKIHIYKQVPS